MLPQQERDLAAGDGDARKVGPEIGAVGLGGVEKGAAGKTKSESEKGGARDHGSTMAAIVTLSGDGIR